MTLMPVVLDPVKFLDEGLTPAESSLACRYVVAYLVRVGAMLGRSTLSSGPITPCLSAAAAPVAHGRAHAVRCH